MTEQEKRIEELGTAIEQLKCGKYHDCSSCSFKDYMFCQSAKLAKELYDADYCKAYEVRKETIKEFIGFIESVIYNYEPTVTETDSGIRTYHYLTDDELFDIIKEKYEKEIKE